MQLLDGAGADGRHQQGHLEKVALTRRKVKQGAKNDFILLYTTSTLNGRDD